MHDASRFVRRHMRKLPGFPTLDRCLAHRTLLLSWRQRIRNRKGRSESHMRTAPETRNGFTVELHRSGQLLISRVISMGRRNTKLEPAWH
jgi:hypothetical protein